jgi:penicillin-binding protein 1A
MLLVVAVTGLFITSVYFGVFGPLPDKGDLTGITNEEASLVLAGDGTLIGKFFAENRTNISWEEIPKSMGDALIATEDKRFFKHKGIDGRSYLRVLFKTILLGHKSSGGGSTITQQLVKNLYGRNSYGFLSMPVSKVKEAIIASRMEKVLTKEEILLLYFNSVPFGEDVYGIQAAAKRYFDKDAIDLNIQESAVLVGMLKANTYYNPHLHPGHAKKRRDQVIGLMAAENIIPSAKADSLKQTNLGLKYKNYQLDSEAAYFVYQAKKRAIEILENIENHEGGKYDIRKDGLKIYTSLDIKLQTIANRAARKQLQRMQPLLDKELTRFGIRKKWEKQKKTNNKATTAWNTSHPTDILTADGIITRDMSKADSLWHYHKMLNAAVLAIDPKTGKVLVWTGGNNFRYLPYDLTLGKRQMASTVKPIIYAAALESGLGPCDYFDNYVKEYKKYKGWKPENYDKTSSEDEKVAMWYALSRSMNLPTLDLYFKTGHDKIASVCNRMGLDAPYEETPSIALGSQDASLMEIVKAYSCFANKGLMLDELIMIEKITTSDGEVIYQSGEVEKSQVISSTTSEQITAMLAVAINEGTGIRLRNTYGIKADLAGKTGTAQNFSDAWFVSYTPNIVIGSWVGASSPKMHFRSGLGSGSSLALPISGEIISGIEKNISLRTKYLTGFDYSINPNEIIGCDAFREKGIPGVFHRLVSSDKENSNDVEEELTEKPPKKRNKLQRFFDNIFKKKKRNKK